MASPTSALWPADSLDTTTRPPARASLNFSHDYIYFSYDDYTNVISRKLYSFGANVFQFYISLWY